MNLVRFLFIASIVAFLWHHRPDKSAPSQLTGCYEESETNPRLTLRFIGPYQVQFCPDGYPDQPPDTYKIIGNTVKIDTPCGIMVLEMQGDTLYYAEHDWRFRR